MVERRTNYKAARVLKWERTPLFPLPLSVYRVTVYRVYSRVAINSCVKGVSPEGSLSV